MGIRTNVIWVCGVLVVLTCTVISGTRNESSPNDPITQANWEGSRQTAATLEKLSHYIDLWHDAYLKGDNSQLFLKNEMLLELLQSDIKASSEFIDHLKLQLQKALQNNKDSKLPVSKIEKMESELNQYWDWLRVKKRLLGNLTRTAAFSNKLRLLGDYEYTLSCELDVGRIKLAGEVELTEPESSE